jgi:hypothetical protein
MSAMAYIAWSVRLIGGLLNSANKRLRSFQELFDRVFLTIWGPVRTSMSA